MKLDHLTFGQLLKLADTSTLMRVTKAYHKMLRRLWNSNLVLDPALFTVCAAESPGAFCDYSELAKPWQQLLKFLRSDELKSALKKSAASIQIPPSCYVSIYRELSEQRFPNRRTREALASIIVTHCKCHGVPAAAQEGLNGTIFVRVATDSMGCAILQNKPGLKWSTIELMCYEMNVCVDRIFWWLSEYRDKTGWRVNPANWPVNTPDYLETAKQLVDAN